MIACFPSFILAAGQPPKSGLPLATAHLVPLEALRRSIETYVSLRPGLRNEMAAKRSLEEAASVLQGELLEKQATNQSIEDELH